MERILISAEPFIEPASFKPGWAWPQWGNWPASWIDHPDRHLATASVVLFRLRFSILSATPLRLHISADNRYRVFLDGERFGEGPERGEPRHWYFESYEGIVSSGDHILIVQNWWLGDSAPYAQMSVRPGIMLAAEGVPHESLTTGRAPWECAVMPGIAFMSPGEAWGTGGKTCIDGFAYPWGWEQGDAALTWKPAVNVTEAVSAAWKNEIKPLWTLLPAALPPMRQTTVSTGVVRYLTNATEPYPVSAARHDAANAVHWTRALAGEGAVRVPPRTRVTAVVDLNEYFCAYPELTVSGGARSRIRLNWAEGLFRSADGGGKGQRDEIENRFFRGGVGDEFVADGGAGRVFTTLWWQAGRYVELCVTTAEDELCIESLRFRATGYPLDMQGTFECSDTRWNDFLPIAERAMQMCSHETFMDCPYYEQLMYIGDTRLEALATYAMTSDAALPRKALHMFDWSRLNSGFTQSRFPSRICQIIPPFSLWWICMVHDYWMWRDDPSFVRERMTGVRAVTEAFRALLRPDNLLSAPNGWNFTDWVKDPDAWMAGVPPAAEFRPSAVLNLQLALTLLKKAEIELSLGEQEMARRDRETARRLTESVMTHFWSESRGLIADDLDLSRFSEHTQCLALLGGLLDDGARRRVSDALFSEPVLSRTTIYFSHYLFETCHLLRRDEVFFDRLRLWFGLADYGFKTTFEEPEPSRSDCHAWGAHPLFHAYATILGIRPASPGFRTVRIAPMPGALTHVAGTLPHPRGRIRVELSIDTTRLNAVVALPDGVDGTFAWLGSERLLTPGESRFTLELR